MVPTKIFKKKLVSLGTKSNRIVVINSNIDLHKFRPRSKTILKRKYGFAGKKVVLYYGALWEDKGLQFLVRAMPKITRENPNVIFVIAPRHWIRKIDAPMINAALNLKNVELVKKVKNIADYVNLADVVVLPYQSINATEGNPSCMLESMACKTAVVTSRIPELKEIVDDEKDVLMSKPGDISGLAKQINRLLSDSNLYKKLVDSSYKKSKDFDVKKIAKEYLKIYSN